MNAAIKQARYGAGHGDCGCGCGCTPCRCDSQCCELECLVRPNFYCGQVLTDADLAALVEWTRSRLSLVRHREGWGVACGLQLSCSAPDAALGCAPHEQGAGPDIWVGNGYALDCCGNDLVLCEPLRVDLSPLCRPAFDPCDPRTQPPGRPPGGAKGTPARSEDCLAIDANELFAVQVSLRYAEDLAHRQRALFAGSCNDDGPCQYGRIREQPCVHLEEIPLATPAAEDDADRWRKAFEANLARQVAAVRAAIQGGSQAVLKLLRHAPPYRYCFLEEMVCCLRKQENPDAPIGLAQWLQIGRLIVLDWMLRQLECPCETCLPDTGVPLGRIIVRRRTQDRKVRCSVVLIEQDPPWRRALRHDPCRPVKARGIDLAPMLGRPTAVLSELSERDVNVEVIDAQPATADELAALIGRLATAVVSHDPATDAGLAAFLVNDVLGVSRVAAFVRLIPQ